MGSGAAVVARNVQVRAVFSTVFSFYTYNEKLTRLAQIYFYTLHPNAYPIAIEACQSRFGGSEDSSGFGDSGGGFFYCFQFLHL